MSPNRTLAFEEIALLIVYRCKCGWERERHHLGKDKCPECSEPIPIFDGVAYKKPAKWKRNPKKERKSTFYVRNDQQLNAWWEIYKKGRNESIKRFFLYGGAVGGGKSYLIRWAAVGLLILWFRLFKLTNVEVYIFCEDYPTLADRHLNKVETEFPQWLGTLKDNKRHGIHFRLRPEWGSGFIKFRNLDDPSKYQSAEFAAAFVDELTKNKIDRFHWIRIRLRWPGLEDCLFVGGTNPGGVGNIWVKQFWIKKIFTPELRKHKNQFLFIPAKATDNPMLTDSYWAELQSLPEEMRHAMVEGDWDFFIGQAFPELSKEFWPKGHAWDATKPLPKDAEYFMAMDWNYARPLSLGWFAVFPINDDRIPDDEMVVHCKEFYAMRENEPDKGLRLTPDKASEKIKEIECNGQPEPDYRVGGNDIFSPLVDGSPSIAEQFEDSEIYFSPLDLSHLGTDDKKRTRIFGKMQLHKRLANHSFAVSTLCVNWWRTVTDLVLDENDPEDVAHERNKKQEDHPFDMTKYALCSRPIFLGPPSKELTAQEKIHEIVTGKMDESEFDDIFLTDDKQAWRDNW